MSFIALYAIVLAITLLHAYIDSYLIKKNKYINHTVEAILYSAVCSMFIYILRSGDTGKWWLFSAITVTIIRTGWFDFALNLMRGKELNYVSPNADGNFSSSQSFYDDLMVKLHIHVEDVRISGFFLSLCWGVYLIFMK